MFEQKTAGAVFYFVSQSKWQNNERAAGIHPRPKRGRLVRVILLLPLAGEPPALQ